MVDSCFMGLDIKLGRAANAVISVGAVAERESEQGSA